VRRHLERDRRRRARCHPGHGEGGPEVSRRPGIPPDVDPSAGQDEVRRLVERLARRTPTGGHVVDRAALLAAGRDFAAAVAFIEARGGEPQHQAAPRARGLHGVQAAAGDGPVRRYLLPPGALA
jgi:hypothetical protein